ncbi:MAG: hypothetical protein QME93_07885 [Bacillota bacterium]|nr:hypothetical protein [Bacillota bacterium]
MRDGGYASVLLAAVLALSLALTAFGAHQVGVASRKASGLDLDTAGARLAADTGLERISRYLAADPAWSDGSVADGPVGPRSRVERVEIAREGEVVRVTSVGVSGAAYPVRKTVWARLRFGLVPLVGAYGGGVKALGGQPLELLGSAQLLSGLLVSGGLSLGGDASVGSDSEPRKVYVSGDISSQKPGAIRGSAYATGTVSAAAATGENVSGWSPPEAFPDIGQVARLVELGRLQARLLESAGGEQRYFPGDHTFTAADLAQMEGVYFVEGTAYLTGGSTSSRATIVAAGGIVLSDSLQAPGFALIAGEDVVARNSTLVHVALIVAGGDAGWGETGGGRGGFRMEYGAMAASTVNGNRIRGNVTLEQDDEVDFALIPGPVQVVETLERVGD